MLIHSLVDQLKTAVVKTHTFVAAAAASYSFFYINVRPLKEGSKLSCPPSQSINFMQLVLHSQGSLYSCYDITRGEAEE